MGSPSSRVNADKKPQRLDGTEETKTSKPHAGESTRDDNDTAVALSQLKGYFQDSTEAKSNLADELGIQPDLPLASPTKGESIAECADSLDYPDHEEDIYWAIHQDKENYTPCLTSISGPLAGVLEPGPYDFETAATQGSSQDGNMEESTRAIDSLQSSELTAPGNSLLGPDSTAKGPSSLPTVFAGSPSSSISNMQSSQRFDQSKQPDYMSSTMLKDNRSVVAQASENGHREPFSSNSCFLKPRLFVGRLAKTTFPSEPPLVQLSVRDRARRNRRSKRTARDGRADIRGIENYYEDPIVESSQ